MAVQLEDDIVEVDTITTTEPVTPPRARTPLPKFQLFIVMLIQFAEPITATVIYPFIIKAVRDTGITKGDEERTGYYAGLIESAFFFAEAVTVVQWGRWSDSIGRRPVLLLGPIGLAISMFGFGWSTTFWPLVAFRFLQGAFNGNIGVTKTMIAEVTDETNIGDAYALIPMTWSVGTTFGPTMGGNLAEAATRWPETLGKLRVIREHPYFLPCAIAGFISFWTFLIAVVGLKESLPSIIAAKKLKERQELKPGDYFSDSHLLEGPAVTEYGTRGTSASEQQSPLTASSSSTRVSSLVEETEDTPAKSTKTVPKSIRSLLSSRTLQTTLLNYAFLTFSDMSYSALQPLVYSMPPSLGGLGLEPKQIGIILGAWGFVNACVQFSSLGRALRHFGARSVYRFAYASIAVNLLMYPLEVSLMQRRGRIDAAVASVMVVQLLLQMLLYCAYGSIQILIVHSSPADGLASINGIAQMLGCVMRTLAPAIATSLFSVSLQRQLLGGHMVYIILCAINVIGIRLSAALLHK